ncbi:MAG TPA: hypothetical protein V6D22_16570 [Candidatus Obscuribacterales bacterium]
MSTFFSVIGFGVVALAIVAATIYVVVNITGETIDALSRYGNRQFWDRQLNKAIWLSVFAGGGWAVYSLYSMAFLPAVFSIIGMLALAYVAGFILINRLDARTYDRSAF